MVHILRPARSEPGFVMVTIKVWSGSDVICTLKGDVMQWHPIDEGATVLEASREALAWARKQALGSNLYLYLGKTSLPWHICPAERMRPGIVLELEGADPEASWCCGSLDPQVLEAPPVRGIVRSGTASDDALRNPGLRPRLRAEPHRAAPRGSGLSCGEIRLELNTLGWTAFFEEAFAVFDGRGLVPGRVAAGHGNLHRVLTSHGELLAEVAGRLRHDAGGPHDLPAVGDWVALEPRVAEGRATIHAVLPRRGAFVRKAAGTAQEAQVLAANVDTVFLVMGLDGDFNLRRLERALVLAWESGAAPVVLLNKVDLCPDLADRRRAAEAAAPGVPVHALSARWGQGLEALTPHIRSGHTVAFLGSSGAGKSTIANRLLGEERLRTAEVRPHDQRGRHTTTHRELIPLPAGALLIDTPGLREVQLWATEDGLAGAFDDLALLAQGCRFRDCRHGGEPGCAVTAAVGSGELSEERLRSHRKLTAELRHLEIRADPDLERAQKAQWRAMHRAARRRRPGM
jgi:ribosome biogenesis GTPase